MISDQIRKLADAILYEGYVLYPYRASAIKNRHRWAFGSVFPNDYQGIGDEVSTMKTEILLHSKSDAKLDIVLRFLQAQRRQVCKLVDEKQCASDKELYQTVATLDVEGQQYVSWDEAIEREIIRTDISVADVFSRPRLFTFELTPQSNSEAIYAPSGSVVGLITRNTKPLEGFMEVGAKETSDGVLCLSITVANRSQLPITSRLSRTDAQNYAFMSTHTLVYTSSGEFVSLLEPPDRLSKAASDCCNQGTWPVLVGDEVTRDTVLSSPIILYDFPKVAAESNGPFFDSAEIDEMLTLRVITMTDSEKREMIATDPQTCAILERCEALSTQQFGALHGALKPFHVQPQPSTGPSSMQPDFSVGHHVRLNPKTRGDVFDIALRGRLARIERIDRDFENRVHFAVTLVDDPGSDLGAAGFPGHRFYFSRDEIELISPEARP